MKRNLNYINQQDNKNQREGLEQSASEIVKPNLMRPLIILSLVPVLVLLSITFQSSLALSDFNIGAAGDYACTSNAVTIINGIKSKSPEQVLGLGDYSYQPTATCWFNENSPVDSITRITIGNHEDENSEDYNSYISHYGLSNPYYSFNINNVHVLVMDSDRTSYSSGSAQYNFVLSDLQAASTNPSIKWIIVTFHRAIYTSPNGCSSCDPPSTLRNTYHPLFDQYGVDLVLQGHIHDYQRTYPLKYNPSSPSNPTRTSSSSNSYNDPAGEIYAIVGTGGNNFHGLNGKSSFVVSQQDIKFGYMDIKITNNGGTLEAKYYLDSGSVSDQFTITKSVTNSSYHYDPSFSATGSNYHEVASSSALQLPKFTVAAWFKTSKTYTTEGIVATKGGIGSDSAGQNNNYGLWITTSQKLSGGFEIATGSDNYVTSPTSYNDGQWHYGVVSYDGTAVKLIVDGTQVGTLSTSASPETSGTLPFRVGANSRAVDRFFTGNIDEVRVWNRGLSSQEATEAFNGNFNTQGQVLYLPFGSGNSPPVANNQAITTTKNTAKAITLTASDPDNNPLTFTVLSQPIHGNLTGVAPSLTYTPLTDYVGSDSFTFKANDGSADSNTATVSITINSPSDTTPPTVSSTDPADGAPGIPVNKVITATFSESVQPPTVSTSTFTLKFGNTPVTGTVSLNGNTNIASFTPSSSLTASTIYTATIKGGSTGVKDTVGNPLAADKIWSFTTAADSQQNCGNNLALSNPTSSGNLNSFPPSNAIDNNLATKWYSTFIVNPWINLDLGSQKSICSVDIAWTDGASRQYSFTISVSTDGSSFTNVFSGKSKGTSSAPEKYTFNESPARFVRITITQSHAGSSTSIAQISEIDVFGKATTSSFSSLSSSTTSKGLENNQQPLSQTNPSNRAPVAKDDKFVIHGHNAISLPIVGNDMDPDGDNVKILSVNSPTNKGGDVTINDNNTVTYTPNSDFVGKDSFSYTIFDGKGKTGDAKVDITVKADRNLHQSSDKPFKPQEPQIQNNEAQSQQKSIEKNRDNTSPSIEQNNGPNSDTGSVKSNKVPVAVAGEDGQVPMRALVVLDGTKSQDEDGKIVAYSWTQLSGPKVTLQHPNEARSTFIVTEKSDNPLEFQLTVVDDKGLSDSDNLTLDIINQSNSALNQNRT